MNTPATLTLDYVWEVLVGEAPPDTLGLHGRALTGVVIDSRNAAAGNLFVALPGERTDGHTFLADAFSRGAIAAIAEPHAQDHYPRARFVLPGGEIRLPEPVVDEGTPELPVIFVVPHSLGGLQRLASSWRQAMPAQAIAITGSIGKTTTKEIVANVIAQRYNTLRNEGNLNNEIGLPLTLLRLRPEHERIILEMGMYAVGEIARLCELARPQIGIVTNVGPSHLERLGSVERIAQAKSELPAALPSAEEGGVAILNADDPLVLMMAGLTKARVFTYGLNPGSTLWADGIESQGLEGIRLRFHYGPEVLHIKLPLLGRHSVHTALRGAAAGLVSGLSWEEIVAGLQEVKGQLRLVVARGLRDTTLIDDTYNASPDSMLAALNLLEEIKNTSHRAVAVLGDMYELGAYEEAAHRLVGGRAAQVANKLVTVGTRARWIAEEALALGMAVADVHPVDGNNDAIAVLQGLIRPGDVVLIKGSRAGGMETIVDALSRSRPPGASAQ